jgi:hypothetical protein
VKNLKSASSGNERVQERLLHLVERALRARFRLWLQNRDEPEASRFDSLQLQGSADTSLCTLSPLPRWGEGTEIP